MKYYNNYKLLPTERELVIVFNEENKIMHITTRIKTGITYFLNNPDFQEIDREVQVVDGKEQIVGITGLLPINYLSLNVKKRKSFRICDIFSRKRRKGEVESN